MRNPDRHPRSTSGLIYPDGSLSPDGRIAELTQRVSAVEQDTQQIKTHLLVLNERAEHFATKTDLAELSSVFSQFKADIYQRIAGLHGDINNQTRWLVATVVSVAAICMTTAKLLF